MGQGMGQVLQLDRMDIASTVIVLYLRVEPLGVGALLAEIRKHLIYIFCPSIGEPGYLRCPVIIQGLQRSESVVLRVITKLPKTTWP